MRRRSSRALIAAVLLLAGLASVVAPSSPAAAATTSGTQYGSGYRIATGNGVVFSFGGLTQDGDLRTTRLAKPIVGIAGVPRQSGDPVGSGSGRGYWMVASDGGIFTYGGAGFFGSTGAQRLNRPIVGMAPTPSGQGYWLVASDGGVFSFGDARFFGSTGAQRLNQPIVGMSAMPDGRGYRLVASDGGIFTFGSATFAGSTGGMRLNRPIVGMAATADGGGYWLVASDGGIFAFGGAPFLGSAGAVRLAQPIVGMATTADGGGYRMVAADGGIFTYGDAGFLGSAAGKLGSARAIGIASGPLVLPKGGYGYDVSWPQCRGNGSTAANLPSERKAFAVIGVTRSRTFTANECLGAEWAWATATGAPAMVYVNVDPPVGDAASGNTGPAGSCAPGDRSCRAYNHGFNAAAYAWDLAASKGVRADLWWLDVEVASFQDPARNAWDEDRGVTAQRAVAGMRDGLRNRGATVGIYSTPYQWQYITSTAPPQSVGQGWDADVDLVWTAGAPSNDLPSYCKPERSFAGGTVALVQGRVGTFHDNAYNPPREFDLDYVC